MIAFGHKYSDKDLQSHKAHKEGYSTRNATMSDKGTSTSNKKPIGVVTNTLVMFDESGKEIKRKSYYVRGDKSRGYLL